MLRGCIFEHQAEHATEEETKFIIVILIVILIRGQLFFGQFLLGCAGFVSECSVGAVLQVDEVVQLRQTAVLFRCTLRERLQRPLFFGLEPESQNKWGVSEIRDVFCTQHLRGLEKTHLTPQSLALF